MLSRREVQLVSPRTQSRRLQVKDVRAVVEPEVVISVRVSSSDHIAVNRRRNLLDLDCMNNDISGRYVVAVDVAELNLDRISSSALHRFRRIVQDANVEADRQCRGVTARLRESTATELSRDRERLRRRQPPSRTRQPFTARPIKA